MAQLGPSAWAMWVIAQQLHDVGCHIIHNACCEAGLKSQREVIVPTLATEKLTEARVDVDASRAPTAAAHSTQLHSRRRRSSSLLFSDAQRTRRGTGRGTGGASERKQIRESEGRSGSHWHLSTAQRTIWARVRDASSQACGVQASNQQRSWQRWRTTTARVAKTSEHGAGEVRRRDSLLGHRAHGLERNVVRTSPTSFICTVRDRTTPCERRVKDRGTQTHTDTAHLSGNSSKETNKQAETHTQTHRDTHRDTHTERETDRNLNQNVRVSMEIEKTAG